MSTRLPLARGGSGARGRAIAWALGLAVLGLPAAAQPEGPVAAAAPPLVISWKAPAPGVEVPWRGIPSLDGSADAAGGILYPAPSLVGFLAAILTHAAMSSAAQSAEQEKAQRVADAVLEPYAATLKGMGADALWRAALATPSAPAGAQLGDAVGNDGWRAEATPRFALAPDAGTLVLDLGAKLQGPGTAPLELLVRVVSTPPAVGDVRQHWSEDEGRALRETAAALLAHGLALLTREARQRSGPPPADTVPFRTHRYRLGALMRAERSQLIALECGRVVLRTLRGGLLSAPVWPAPAAEPAGAGAVAVAAAASAAVAASAAAGSAPAVALADTACPVSPGL